MHVGLHEYEVLKEYLARKCLSTFHLKCQTPPKRQEDKGKMFFVLCVCLFVFVS